MRIAMVSDNFYPELGGIQDSVLSLARELGARGHSVCCYVPAAVAKNFEVAHLPFEEIDLGKNVRIERVFSLPIKSPTQQSRFVIPTGRLTSLFKKFAPDIIHSHTFFGLGLDARHAARHLNIPFVGTNHWAIAAFDNYFPHLEKVFQKYSLKFVSWYYNACVRVSAPSHSVFVEMLKNNFSASYQVISNPIDTDVFHAVTLSEKKILKKKLALPEHTLVYAGRLAVEKKIDVVIRALALVQKKFPDVVLALAGHGTDRVRLEALISELALEKNVKFFGTLDKAHLAELYQASDVFTIASCSETQSMVLLQAAASGLPAVGVNSRGLAEYIQKESGFLASPDNVEEFAEHCIFLLKNPDQRLALSEGARKYAQKFSVKNILDQWEDFYKQSL
jgi:1,2-diacylglycerol 3-alpha-glucosyltransferase